jgi:hypothetical protein
MAMPKTDRDRRSRLQLSVSGAPLRMAIARFVSVSLCRLMYVALLDETREDRGVARNDG